MAADGLQFFPTCRIPEAQAAVVAAGGQYPPVAGEGHSPRRAEVGGYRTDFLPNWRDWLALNPLTSMIEGFRWCLLGGRTDFYERGLWLSLAVSVFMLATGFWYFRRTERQFADVI